MCTPFKNMCALFTFSSNSLEHMCTLSKNVCARGAFSSNLLEHMCTPSKNMYVCGVHVTRSRHNQSTANTIPVSKRKLKIK